MLLKIWLIILLLNNSNNNNDNNSNNKCRWQVDEATYDVDSDKETVIHQLGFASPRHQYVDYCSRAGGT